MGKTDVGNEYLHERDVSPYAWLLRPCLSYWEEHEHCTSFKKRFYQYFTDGKIADCSHWKMSGRLCDRWEKKQDKEALLALIELDKKRYVERLKPHYDNDVWMKRQGPPKNWNITLPEDHQKRIEESYVKLMMEHNVPTRACVIL